MTTAECESLRADPRFDDAFRRWARQRFPPDDISDAIQEAWRRILEAPIPHAMERDEYLCHYALIGMRGIRNYWMREYRRRRKMAGKPCDARRQRAAYMRLYRRRHREKA